MCVKLNLNENYDHFNKQLLTPNGQDKAGTEKIICIIYV